MKKSVFKNILIFISPILIFVVLLIPYSIINQEFIVDWLGCGCPKTDELGNIIHPSFDANDFTRLFWGIVTLGATILSFFISKKIPKENTHIRVAYIILILLVSLFIAFQFCQMMMWK